MIEMKPLKNCTKKIVNIEFCTKKKKAFKNESNILTFLDIKAKNPTQSIYTMVILNKVL